MVKYGRHLEFLRQRFPKSVYLVDYKGIQHSTDRAAFSADWQEGLARATAAKEEGVAGLWSRVFQGVSSDPELRGVRPLVALHTYHGAVGAAETQQLLDIVTHALYTDKVRGAVRAAAAPPHRRRRASPSLTVARQSAPRDGRPRARRPRRPRVRRAHARRRG